MRLKKIGSFFVMLFAVLTLFACNDVNINLTINGIDGYEATINEEEKTISFQVGNDVANLKQEVILLPEEVLLSIYADEEKTSLIEGDLSLAYGDNTFYLTLTYAQSAELTSSWTLIISRLEPAVASPVDITNVDWKTTYYLEDKFVEGKITVLYNDNTTKEVTLTEEMVSGFSTTTVGEIQVTITYEGILEIITITVKEPVGVESISVKNWNNLYYVGQEFVPGVLTINYSDDTTEEITLTADIVTGFDTTTTGKKAITITYEEISIEVDYEVLEDRAKNLVVPDNYKKEYLIGEEFAEFSITVEYMSGKTEEVTVTSDMLTGFDTSKRSESLIVTISYLGQEATLEIEVNAVVIEIVVKNLKQIYMLGDEFSEGLLEVTYSDNIKEEITLTADMVTGFDTATVGKKTLVISYAGISTNYEIEIVNEAPTVTVDDINRTYYLNEEFVPFNMTLNYPDGQVEEIEVTKDMVTGFDTTTTGWKKLIVEYLNSEITVDYLVTSTAYDDYVLPTPTTISDNIIYEFLEEGYVTILMLQGASEEIAREEFTHNKDYLYADLKPILEKAAFTDQDLVKLTILLTQIEGYIADIYSETDTNERIKKAISAEMIEIYKTIITELLDLISTEQIAVILTEIQLVSKFSSGSDFTFIVDLNDYLTLFWPDDIVEKAIEADLPELAEFLKEYTNNTEIKLDFAIATKITDFFKTLIYSLLSVDSSDIANALTLIPLIDEYQTFANIPNADLVKVVNSLGTILKEFASGTNNAKIAAFIIKNFIPCLGSINSNGNEEIFNLFALGLKHGEIIGSILESLDENDMQMVKEFLNIFTQEDLSNAGKPIVYLAKKIEPLLQVLENNTDDIQVIENFFIAMNGSFTKGNITKLIQNALNLAKLDYENLTEEENYLALETIYIIFMGGSLSVGGNLLIPYGASVEETFDLANKYLYVYYQGTPITLNEDNTIGLDSSNLGINKLYITQGTDIAIVNYYVFEEGTGELIRVEPLRYMDTTPLLYINQESALITHINSIRELSNFNMPAETFDPSRLAVVYYLKYETYIVRIEKSLAEFEKVEFEIDTETVGLKFGSLNLEIDGITLKYPFQAFVYNTNNPVYGVYNMPENIYAVEGKDETIRNQFILSENFGLHLNMIEEVFISAEETRGKAGQIIQKELIEGIGVYINVIVISEEESKGISSITGWVKAPLSGEGFKSEFANVTISFKDNNYLSGPIKDLENYYDLSDYGIYALEIVLENIPATPQVVFERIIAKDESNNVLFEGTIEVNYVLDEEYNSFNVSLNDVVMPEIRDFKEEEILEKLSGTIYYNVYAEKVEISNIADFMKSNNYDFGIRLIESSEHQLRYEFWFIDGLGMKRIHTFSVYDEYFGNIPARIEVNYYDLILVKIEESADSEKLFNRLIANYNFNVYTLAGSEKLLTGEELVALLNEYMYTISRIEQLEERMIALFFESKYENLNPIVLNVNVLLIHESEAEIQIEADSIYTNTTDFAEYKHSIHTFYYHGNKFYINVDELEFVEYIDGRILCNYKGMELFLLPSNKLDLDAVLRGDMWVEYILNSHIVPSDFELNEDFVRNSIEILYNGQMLSTADFDYLFERINITIVNEEYQWRVELISSDYGTLLSELIYAIN